MKRDELVAEIDDVLRKHSSTHPANLHRIEGLLREARAALSSPCACGGREPVKVVETHGYCDADGCWVVRESPMASLGLNEEAEKPMSPLTIIILPDEEGAKE